MANTLVTAQLCGDRAKDRRQGKGSTAAAPTAGGSVVCGAARGWCCSRRAAKGHRAALGSLLASCFVGSAYAYSALVQ